METEIMYMLQNGTSVPKAYYDYLRQHYEKRVHELDRYKNYTARQMDEDFWALQEGKKTLAGQCILNMAELKHLPLEVVPKNHEYPKYYRITL